jgi:transposase
MKDFHYKLAWHLCSNFENICWPNFKASEIMMLDLNAGVKRRLNMLSFYKLICCLLEICKVVYGGSLVHRGSEAYSSMMCGLCNRLKENLSGSRIYRCQYEDCYFSSVDILRDINGAHGIEMLSYLHSEFPLSHDCWKRSENLKYVRDGTTVTREGVLVVPH